MKIYDRKLKKAIEEKDYNALPVKLLYNNILGRTIVKTILVKKTISKLNGKRYSSKRSVRIIPKFIKKHQINMEDYPIVEYKSFNDFFTREIKPEKRPIDRDSNALISCADSLLTVYTIDDNLTFKLKNSYYTVDELLQNKTLSKKYTNGYCLIFRLTVRDYHHYCFIDEGTCENEVEIKGVLHTVNPIANKKVKVYKENNREYTTLHTKNFDDVVMIEVGALMVGKIKNNNKKSFQKGEEKGYFEFGGSTVILLFKENTIKIDEDIINNSQQEIETRVKMGEKIGEKFIK